MLFTQGLFDDAAEYSQTLTSAELNLFVQGLNAAKNIHQWRSMDSGILQRRLSWEEEVPRANKRVARTNEERVCEEKRL